MTSFIASFAMLGAILGACGSTHHTTAPVAQPGSGDLGAGDPCGSDPGLPPPPPPPPLLSVAWLKAGAGDMGFAEAVAVRGDGSVIVGGMGDLAGWTKRKKAKLLEAFVAVIDAKGEYAWSKMLGDGTVRSVSPYGDGVVACGDFKTLVIDGKRIASTASRGDIFVVALDGKGKLEWSFTAGGGEYDACDDLVLMPDGRVAIAGTLEGFFKFGTLNTKPIMGRDAFVAVLDGKGAPQWVDVGGSHGDDEARAITYSDSALFITGSFGDNATFGKQDLQFPEPDRTRVANPSNAFTARYELAGTVTWAQPFGEPSSFDRGWSIAPLTDGGVVVVGDTVDHPFILRYDKDGSQRWVRFVTGGTARAVAALPGDDVLVSIQLGTSGVVSFDDNPQTAVTARGEDSVIARYSPLGDLRGIGTLGGSKAHTPDERNGDELDVMDIATVGSRIVFAGRLAGTSKITGGKIFKESPAQVTSKAGQEIVVVATDSP